MPGERHEGADDGQKRFRNYGGKQAMTGVVIEVEAMRDGLSYPYV